MLVIRLTRAGRNKYPTYRIVAAESARAATGKFVAVLGHYNPHTKELVIKQEETIKHLSNGAQPSNTVVKLLMREKVDLPGWVELKTKAPKPVEKPAEAQTAAPVAAAAETDAAAESADATPENPAAIADEAETPEAHADEQDTAPALEHPEERVAEVNEEAASEAGANVTPEDSTETAK